MTWRRKGTVVLLPEQLQGLARLPIKGAVGISQDRNLLYLDFGYGLKLVMGMDGFIDPEKQPPKEDPPC